MDKVRLFVKNKIKINKAGSDIPPEAAATRSCHFWIDATEERQGEI